jgi:plastocyanin
VSTTGALSRARGGIAAALLALGTLTCANSKAAPVPGITRHEIRMRSNSFAPRDLAVTLGDTVTWRNTDIVRHNARRREAFDTGELKGGESYSWVPADTGMYAYRCTIHQRMRGRVTVVSPH